MKILSIDILDKHHNYKNVLEEKCFIVFEFYMIKINIFQLPFHICCITAVSFYMVQENFESNVYLKYNILMIEF